MRWRKILNGNPMTTQHHHKSHLMIWMRLCLLKSWILSITLGKKLDHLHLKRVFSNTKVYCTWTNHWQRPNTRSLLLTAPRTTDLPLELDGGPQPLFFRGNILCHFCCSNVFENEAHFELECLQYNSIRDEFQSLFENVVLWSLKSFFQLDHDVNISLYLTEATPLRHCRE